MKRPPQRPAHEGQDRSEMPKAMGAASPSARSGRTRSRAAARRPPAGLHAAAIVEDLDRQAAWQLPGSPGTPERSSDDGQPFGGHDSVNLQRMVLDPNGHPVSPRDWWQRHIAGEQIVLPPLKR